MGDSSDNYPGVSGVGEKTAMELIRKYRTVDAIYAALPEIEAKPGVIKKLQEGEESARLSYHHPYGCASPLQTGGESAKSARRYALSAVP